MEALNPNRTLSQWEVKYNQLHNENHENDDGNRNYIGIFLTIIASAVMITLIIQNSHLVNHNNQKINDI